MTAIRQAASDPRPGGFYVYARPGDAFDDRTIGFCVTDPRFLPEYLAALDAQDRGSLEAMLGAGKLLYVNRGDVVTLLSLDPSGLASVEFVTGRAQGQTGYVRAAWLCEK